jgi:Domain of unknown function (DUF1839)
MPALLGLDPGTYRPHELHSPERQFPETNCYTDLWIELLHAQGFEPLAMLAYCVVVDFEGDQWTFFKPPPEDLARLYGLEVQEFVVYRSLPEHIVEQLELGRSVIVEADAFYLPDTAGRSYREQHEKSSVAVESLDFEGERMRYFHGPGYYEVAGDDYRNALRLGREFSVDVLPPYIEFVRSDRLTPCPAHELRSVASELLQVQLARTPVDNPVGRFGTRLSDDLPHLLENEQAYHLYAFATVRQCGASWDAAGSFLAWLADGEDGSTAAAAAAFADLAGAAKMLLFKLARASATGRPLDPAPAIESMAATWEQALRLLGGR